MKNRAELCNDMDVVIKKYVPKWKVIPKIDSWSHRLIAKLLVCLRVISFGRVDIDYMGSFWTTLGYTAAYPEGDQYDWETRGHEGLHGIQARRWTPTLMGYLYLFPQSFLPLVFTALAIVYSPWFYLGILVGLAPLPAPFRAYWELKAYEISVMLWEWQWGKDTDQVIEHMVEDIFAGPTYYFMFPFRNLIRKRLLRAKERAQRWETLEDREPYIDDLYNVVKAGGRLHGNNG